MFFFVNLNKLEGVDRWPGHPPSLQALWGNQGIRGPRAGRSGAGGTPGRVLAKNKPPKFSKPEFFPLPKKFFVFFLSNYNFFAFFSFDGEFCVLGLPERKFFVPWPYLDLGFLPKSPFFPPAQGSPSKVYVPILPFNPPNPPRHPAGTGALPVPFTAVHTPLALLRAVLYPPAKEHPPGSPGHLVAATFRQLAEPCINGRCPITAPPPGKGSPPTTIAPKPVGPPRLGGPTQAPSATAVRPPSYPRRHALPSATPACAALAAHQPARMARF